jgi:hypothetical protein
LVNFVEACFHRAQVYGEAPFLYGIIEGFVMLFYIKVKARGTAIAGKASKSNHHLIGFCKSWQNEQY